MSKARRIDYYFDDHIAGTGMLDLEERGMHWTACSLIYSHGGPIERDHLRKHCPGHGRTFNRVLDRLLQLGKLFETADGKLAQKRCETELENARKRIETSQKNGQKGGRVSRENNEIRKPAGSSRAREGITSTTTTNLKKRKNEGDELGRSAPSAKDLAAVERIVRSSVTVLKRRGGVALRDPLAYETAVDATVWGAWLNRLASYAGRAFSVQRATEAQEAVEEARRAGSRKASPPHIRKVLNELDRLDRYDRVKNRRSG